MFFNPCHFLADCFCKCTFGCFPIHIAKESGNIRIDGVTFPFGIRKIFVARSPSSNPSFSMQR